MKQCIERLLWLLAVILFPLASATVPVFTNHFLVHTHEP